MKKYLPWISIITYGIIAAIALVLVIFSGTAGLWVCLVTAIAAAPALVGEIIGVVLRAKKGFRFSDNLALLIANIAALIPTVIFIVDDMNSTGWFAGLGGFLALITVVPTFAVSLIIDLVFFIVRKKKQKAENIA